MPIVPKVRAWFCSLQGGSIKGFISTQELVKSLAVALGAGTSTGLLLVVIQTIHDNAARIFPNPVVATLVVVITAGIASLWKSNTDGIEVDHLKPGQRVPSEGAIAPDPETTKG